MRLAYMLHAISLRVAMQLGVELTALIEKQLQSSAGNNPDWRKNQVPRLQAVFDVGEEKLAHKLIGFKSADGIGGTWRQQLARVLDWSLAQPKYDMKVKEHFGLIAKVTCTCK